MQELPRLTAEQTARRLGVKPATVYAYVSRGLLTRVRTPTGSLFDPLELEEFAARRAHRPPTDTVRAAGSPLQVVDTDVAVVLDDELFLRGRSAAELARHATLVEVAQWLWHLDGPWPGPDPDDAQAIRHAVAALPAAATALDRVRVAITALAAGDPMRADGLIEHVRLAGARILAALPVAVAPQAAAGSAPSSSPAGDPPSLWRALSTRAPSAADERALQAALILTVDHDLAISTMAARIAASARGSAYAIASAALGAFESPLHGTASRAARELIDDVIAGGSAERAIAAALVRTGPGVPGFGQALYSGIDARAAVLLPLVYGLRGGRAVQDAVTAIAAVVVRRTGLRPNIDLALAALTAAARMPADAGTVVFAVGRMVGWVAHALAEYREPPMRLRPRGRYVGPTP